MIPKSIQWRLQLWHGVTLVLVLAGFAFTAFRLQHADEYRRLDQELDQRANAILETLHEGRPGRPPPEEDGPGDYPGARPRPRGSFRPSAGQSALFGDPGNFYFILWRRDGRVMDRSTNAPEALAMPALAAGSSRGARDRGLLREVYQFTPPGECVLVGRSTVPERARLQRFALALSGLGTAVLGAGLAVGWWLVSRAIRPIRDISDTASRIATGDLSQRIPAVETENELGQLTAVLNSTFARLESAFAQQARFTADASHELRTPVSVILTQTQAALHRERPAAEYRETIEACQRAAQRMRRLIESLLALARFDAGQEALNRTPVDLASLAADALDLVRPLGEERHLTLQAALEPAPCNADADRLSLVITNLLTNAIHHNHDGGEVHIATRAEPSGVVLTVSNTGPGIGAEHLRHIFDRFYRADPARTTAQGRTGLGLAISKAIVEAHAGSIEVASPPGGRTTFTIRLPV